MNNAQEAVDVRRSSYDDQRFLPGMRSLSNKKTRSVEDLYIEGGSSKDVIESSIEALIHEAAAQEQPPSKGSLLKDVLDISSPLTDGGSAITDDSFLRCFTTMPPDNWNWNLYLFPLWCIGVVVRHCILFPLRLFLLLSGFVVFFILFFSVRLFLKDGPLRRRIERSLVCFQCGIFVASWTGVVKFHGPRPVTAINHVWVANHTSMIDYIILCSHSPFAVIMQLHPGWVGFLQTAVLGCLGCIWFNRTEVKDRKFVRQRMQEYISKEGSAPLLIFPEGTCVNNEYCVMFKRGAFDLDATVCPIAIKYNRSFVDAFWNSKRQSFTAHLVRLMTSWAVVCDVYFLEPQNRRPGEDATDFAVRVQEMIAKQAQLRIVPWDGYLKYYNLGQKNPHLIEKRRKDFAASIKSYITGDSTTPTKADRKQD